MSVSVKSVKVSVVLNESEARDYGELSSLSTSYAPLQGTYQCVTLPFATTARSARYIDTNIRMDTNYTNISIISMN